MATSLPTPRNYVVIRIANASNNATGYVRENILRLKGNYEQLNYGGWNDTGVIQARLLSGHAVNPPTVVRLAPGSPCVMRIHAASFGLWHAQRAERDPSTPSTTVHNDMVHIRRKFGQPNATRLPPFAQKPVMQTRRTEGTPAAHLAPGARPQGSQAWPGVRAPQAPIVVIVNCAQFPEKHQSCTFQARFDAFRLHRPGIAQSSNGLDL